MRMLNAECEPVPHDLGPIGSAGGMDVCTQKNSSLGIVTLSAARSLVDLDRSARSLADLDRSARSLADLDRSAQYCRLQTAWQPSQSAVCSLQSASIRPADLQTAGCLTPRQSAVCRSALINLQTADCLRAKSVCSLHPSGLKTCRLQTA